MNLAEASRTSIEEPSFGWTLFCHLVIKAIKLDSQPRQLTGEALKIALLDASNRLDSTRHQFAEKFGISMVTLRNWDLVAARNGKNRKPSFLKPG
jgi:predicted methyltransferase